MVYLFWFDFFLKCVSQLIIIKKKTRESDYKMLLNLKLLEWLL